MARNEGKIRWEDLLALWKDWTHRSRMCKRWREQKYIFSVDEEESDSSSEMHKQMKIFKPGASYMKAITNNGKK